MNAILLSADDAAELLSMTPRRLVRLAKAGKVPSVDLGDGELRFSPEQLREWAKDPAAKREGTTDAR